MEQIKTHEEEIFELKISNTELKSHINKLEISNNKLEISNNRLEISNTELKSQINKLEISNNKLEISNTERESHINKLESHIEKLIQRNADQDEARLRLFRANTLVDLVKKLSIDLKLDPPEKPDETKDNKKRRITQVAQSIKQQQLEFFFKEDGKKYGPLYFKLLQKMDKVRD